MIKCGICKPVSPSLVANGENWPIKLPRKGDFRKRPCATPYSNHGFGVGHKGVPVRI